VDLIHKKQVVAMHAADNACVIGLLPAREDVVGREELGHGPTLG